MSSVSSTMEELPWENQVSEILVEPTSFARAAQRSNRIRIDAADDGGDAGSACSRARDGVVSTAQRVASLFPTYVAMAQKDRKERPGSFWLSFASVAFVVGLCAVLVTIVASLPVVFLKLSEVENGLIDLTLSPGGSATSASSLNFTRLSHHLSELVAGGALDDAYGDPFPSIAWSASAYSLAQCGNAESARALWYLPADLAAKVADDKENSDGGHASSELLPRIAVCRQGCFNSHCGVGAGPRVSVVGLLPHRVEGRVFVDEGVNAALADLAIDGGIVTGLDGGTSQDRPRVVGRAVLNTNVASELRVSVGDHIIVGGDIGDALRALAPNNILNVGGWQNGNTLVELRVVHIISSSLAEKFMGTNEWLVVHYDAVPALVAAGLSPVIPSAQAARVAASDVHSAAHKVHFTMETKARDAAYYRSGYKAIRARVAAWSAPLVGALGPSQLSVRAPVLSFMFTLDFFSMFVSLVMGVLTMVFAVLSTLLNYALLTVGLERRRYDIGVQRMIGFTRTDVVGLVLSQSFLYTLPAWLVGLVGGQLFYFGMRLLIQWLADVPMRLWLSWNAVAFSTALALFIPLAASVFPIRNLLASRLSEALDTTRGAALSGVRYQIKTPAKEESKQTYTIGGLGFVFAVLGIAVYYLLPLSLLRMDLSTLFSIFFAVLLGMVCGLVLLTSNAEVVVQFTLVQILLRWWESRSVVTCTVKNLTAHRARNRRTTLLYTLAVSLAIFLTVMLNMNFRMLQFIQYRNMGNCLTATFRLRSTDIARRDSVITPVSSEQALLRRMRNTAVTISRPRTARGVDGDVEQETFIEYALDGPERRSSAAFLSDYASVETLLRPLIDAGVVAGITYRIPSLKPMLPAVVVGNSVSTYGRYSRADRGIQLIPPNAFDVLDSQFVVLRDAPVEVAHFGLSASLYAATASHRVLIASSLARHLALTGVNDSFLLSHSYSASASDGLITDTWPSQRQAVVSPAAILDSCPVYFMTRFPNNLGDILSSIPVGLAKGSHLFASADLLPLQSIHIRLADNSDASEVKRRVRAFLDARNIYTYWNDPDTSVKDIKMAFRYLSALLVFAQVMIYVVCFFSLMSSMTTNVLSSSKEIGILLALGMQHTALYRAFIWEALTLVLSSGFLGACIGVVMAYTIQMQSSLLNQITMPFMFATRELIMLFVVGIVSAILASYSPVRFLLSLPSTSTVLNFN